MLWVYNHEQVLCVKLCHLSREGALCPLFLFSPPLTGLLAALREREGCCDGVTLGGKWAATSVMMTDAEAPVTIAKKGRQSCNTLFHRTWLLAP